MKKKRTRMIIDIFMTVLLPILMAYSLIGEKFHEIAGTLMFALFIAHHILNIGWYKALLKGRYTIRRAFQTIMNMFLLLFMIVQPVSGILMSKHLYTFIDIAGTSTAREIHLMFAYWGFVLMCLHAGTHLTVPLGKLRRNSPKVWCVVSGVLSVISIYGCYAFVKRQLAEYMLRRSLFVFFDYSEPRIWFFLDYLTIMILFAFAGYFITSALMKTENHNKTGKENER